ncbi:hypothetical protein HT031_002564 [Scenedesmus sp. PABB004]|nr:hypothetical protein HT031_002564 [Scenedesmus sp. PABB004]
MQSGWKKWEQAGSCFTGVAASYSVKQMGQHAPSEHTDDPATDAAQLPQASPRGGAAAAAAPRSAGGGAPAPAPVPAPGAAGCAAATAALGAPPPRGLAVWAAAAAAVAASCLAASAYGSTGSAAITAAGVGFAANGSNGGGASAVVAACSRSRRLRQPAGRGRGGGGGVAAAGRLVGHGARGMAARAAGAAGGGNGRAAPPPSGGGNGRGGGTFSGGSAAELEHWLERHGVQVARYGQGSARTTQELFDEVANAESVLTVHASNGGRGRALRLVSVLNLYIQNGQGQVLIEAGQRLPDGRLRQRGLPLSEKMIGHEGWQAAAVRAVGEELATALPHNWRAQLVIDEGSYHQLVEMQESTSYPGLLTQYTCHKVSAQLPCLPAAAFSTREPRPNGELTNYWEWRDPGPTLAAVMRTQEAE